MNCRQLSLLESNLVKDMQLAYHNMNWEKYELMLPNCHVNAGYEMDILCLRKKWYVEEIEIKTSVSDFRADFKKTITEWRELVGPLPQGQRWRMQVFPTNKHKELQAGCLVSNYFSFLVPEDLSEKIEIPDYAGLYIYIGNGRIQHRKAPKLLHKNKPSIQTLYHWSRKCSFRYWDLLNEQKRRMA